MLWGVVGLPVLLPLVALLQLLFPGILRDQWRQYRYAVQTLLTQSTLIFVQWALVKWVFTQRPWWLSDDALAAALVVVALVGVARAWTNRHAGAAPGEADRTSSGKRPASVEFWALGITLAAGLAWAAYALYSGGSPWDQMSVVSLAALAGVLHLLFRSARARTGVQPWQLSTELVFVLALAAAGTGVGLYARQTDDNLLAGEVRSEWPTFHANSQRTGSLSTRDRGPERPQVLWTFDPRERKGRISIHSSPCVVDGQVYVGAMHQVLGLAQGFLYCVNAADGRQRGDKPVPLGGRLWGFSATGTLKAVFSSPVIVAGRVYIGEGYHQDSGCRLMCLDAQSADRVLWSKPTASHVESTPTVAADRVYFGAGDDGLRCVDGGSLESRDGEYPVPRTLWHVTGVHVDSSPTLENGRLFAGSVLGEQYQEFCALGVDAGTGQVLWKVPAPLPLPSAPAALQDRVYFALGNGKLNEDADAPDGRIWCLDAAAGQRHWEFRAANSILGSPAVADGRVYCVSRDQHGYALDAESGAVLWRRDLGEPAVASPVVAGGRVFLLTTGGVLFALDAATGEVVWRFDAVRNDAGDAWSSPALADGRLYVASGGKLFAIGDAQP